VDTIANFSDTDAYWAVMAELIRPQGAIVAIVGNRAPLDLNLLKAKSVSFHWEFMFTRPQFRTPDRGRQGEILERLAELVAAGEVQGTATTVRKPEQTLGYELSGNSALFKGNLKLLRNMPPLGDGVWRLYDLSKDPGETQDLSAQLPQEFTTMQADFVVWAQANQVLDMPPDYSPQKQVMINGFWRYGLPVHGKTMALILVALVLLPVWLLWRKRKRRL
jgi:arylsulfatase/uncharacterized sulfatase